MDKEEELIDLNKLSQRELLILLHKDVAELKDDLKEEVKELRDLKLKVESLETRSKIGGAVAGILAAIGLEFLIGLIKTK